MIRIILVVVILVAGAVGGYTYYQQQEKKSTVENMPTVSAEIGTGSFTLYAPDSNEGLQRGLAIFDTLPQDKGMIFRGLPVGVQPFTMRDMKFDIDILWVDKDNIVTHVVYSASKDSYPQRFENPISRPSAYVIELNAGAADEFGLFPGTPVAITE